MQQLLLALQVYSVREDAEKDFKGTMQKVKEIGYDYVELAGLYGMNAEKVKEILDETGVKAISAHVPLAELSGDAEQVVSDYVKIGCKYIAIPYLTDDLRPNTPGFQEVLAKIPAIGRACRDHGAVLLYHNHDFEFVRMPDNSYGLDYLYDHITADLLQTELDTCWIKVAGEDPVAYLHKYAGRCPVVHLKDFYKEGNPDNLYELIGIESNGNQDQKKGKFEFRPIGYGMQVMPEIVEAAGECGAKLLVVEQDASVGRSAMEAVKMSRDYLRPLGI
jgi:Sugar phosphate isomerases/epimerases